jgi:radical SAM enzyme (TIGR01210 family)
MPIQQAVVGTKVKVRSTKAPEDYISTWREEDVLDGRPAVAQVVVMNSLGCIYEKSAGCSMCGYYTETLAKRPPPEAYIRQIEKAIAVAPEGAEVLKVYTSGNFLDEREVQREAQVAIVDMAAKRYKRLLVESRPEFVTDDRLGPLLGRGVEVEVAFGLETSNDRVLDETVNKGNTAAENREGALRARALGARVKSYLLLKPPFLTEAEALEDAVTSAAFAAAFSDTVSINPMNIHKGTLVERLFYDGAYRPPWLWTVAEAMGRALPQVGERARLMSAPTGASTRRGASNCGACDARVLEAIRRASVDQDPAHFEGLSCPCRARWQWELTLGPLAPTAAPLA